MKIEITKLTTGSHKSKEQGACVMEFVSLLANEPWSDHPTCASSSITSFCIWINDNGQQAHRDKLLLLAPKIVGTKDHSKESARAKIFSDFAFWSKEKADGFAKSAEYAKYAAESAADSVKYAAESAEYAAESAEYAADSVKYAAKYAAEFAEYAAEYAAKSAESAEYAADAAFKIELFDKAIETLEKCLSV